MFCRFVRRAVSIAPFSSTPDSRPRHFDNGNCAREVAPLSLDLVQDSRICSRPEQPAADSAVLSSHLSASLALSPSVSLFLSISHLSLTRRRRALFSASIEAALNILCTPDLRSLPFSFAARNRELGTDVAVVFLAFCRLILSVFTVAGFWLLR